MAITNMQQVPETVARFVTKSGTEFFAIVRRNDRKHAELKIERAEGCFEVLPYCAIDRVTVPLCLSDLSPAQKETIMSFANLETEALESDCPNVSNLLSIAWANVEPLIPVDQVDGAANAPAPRAD